MKRLLCLLGRFVQAIEVCCPDHENVHVYRGRAGLAA